MSTQKISKRKLTKLEAADFAAEIAQTPNITGYTPKELETLKDVFVIASQNQTNGMLAYIETDKFVDLKILIVKEAFRGRGLGSKLFTNFMEQFGATQKPIYVVTRNKVVVAMLEQQGFRKTSLHKLPLPCILHQLEMLFSFYRAKEYIRKLVTFRRQGRFAYYIK